MLRVARVYEAQIQSDILMAMSRQFDCRTVHVPNGGKRGVREGVKLKAMGVWAGHPDLIIYGNGQRSFMIEVKEPHEILASERNVPTHERFESLSESQQKAVPELRARGFIVHVIDNVDDAIAAGHHFGLDPKRLPRAQA